MRVHTQPHAVEKTLDQNDQARAQQIIQDLRQTYADRLHNELLEFHRAQRALNRASHEVRRLEKHIARIDTFIGTHDVKEGK